MFALALNFIQLAAKAWAVALPLAGAAPPTAAFAHHSAVCSLSPGTALALVRVEQDTMLPNGGRAAEPFTATGVRPGAYDSLLATPSTPMPGARVRLLQIDSATRALLASEGVQGKQPRAYLRAAPYRADCRTIRYTDTVPFVVRGEVGYIRAYLRPREEWIDGHPVFAIPDVWNYPYPRRRGLAFRVSSDAPLAPPDAMYGFLATIELPRATSLAQRLHQDSIRRERALSWAQANTTAAEFEPLRTFVRRTVLAPDWERAKEMPSRLRGTYRVDVAIDDRRSTWFFRTHDRPGYSSFGQDSAPSTAALLQLPFVFGYSLVGEATPSREALPGSPTTGPAQNVARVWLATNDRPTAPGNNERRALSGYLEFQLPAMPEVLWDGLDTFVPPMHPLDSMMLTRMNRLLPRNRRQPRLPLTVRLGANGEVRADTVLVTRGRRMTVSLERIDTLSLRRPF